MFARKGEKPMRGFGCGCCEWEEDGQASNGNRSRLMEERAPSTAEEFQRVAEEKAKEAKEGVASQNVGKSHEGTIGDSKVESVKNRY